MTSLILSNQKYCLQKQMKIEHKFSTCRSTLLIQNSLHQNKSREEVKNRKIRYLPDLSIIILLSVYVLVQRILNYYPNYPTHRLYFGEVKTPYI